MILGPVVFGKEIMQADALHNFFFFGADSVCLSQSNVLFPL